MKKYSLPKISIVTANLNGAATLERAIQSIIYQDYQNLEYVIIDGGSTDSSLDIIERYTDKIDVVLIEKDQGISDAFNKGINRATGDIIGIISSDDFLAEVVLNDVAESYLQNNKPDVIYGDAGFLEDNRISLVRPDGLDKIWSRQPLKHSSVFVARNAYEKWGKFSLEYRNAMDYEFILRLYVAGAKFVYIPKTLSFFSAGGVNQKNLTQTIREVRDISARYGRSKLKANFTWFGKFVKIFLKRVLSAIRLTSILSIYRLFSPRYRTRGHFITFSGIDGAGKSTQIALLRKCFQDKGRRPGHIWSRGGYTSFLENVKSLLRKI
jgi:glycosyltransferase involved in cell wall biosynthesis